MVPSTRTRRDRTGKTPAPTISEQDWYGPDGHKKVLEARAKGDVTASPKRATADSGCGTYYKQTSKPSERRPERSGTIYTRTNIARYNARHADAISKGLKKPLVKETDPKEKAAHLPQDADRGGWLHEE